MRIKRVISSINPSMCQMVAKSFFGNVIGEVRHDWPKGSGYVVIVRGEITGGASDFMVACNMLLDDLKVVKTVCV